MTAAATHTPPVALVAPVRRRANALAGTSDHHLARVRAALESSTR
jgi:hypothetical protein